MISDIRNTTAVDASLGPVAPDLAPDVFCTCYCSCPPEDRIFVRIDERIIVAYP